MRIVSLLPSATEIVCALGLGEQLVGVTHECDFPSGIGEKPHLTASRISHENMTSLEIDHAVRAQLDGHGSIYDLNVDLLADLKPDLIITQELCEVCAVSYSTVTKAARMYAAEAQVVSLEPHTVSDVLENIRLIASITSVENRGIELTEELAKRFEALTEKAKSENPVRTFMLEWLEPPFSPGHWVPEQVTAAGGVPLLGRVGEKSVPTDYGVIADSAPETMVFIPCGYYTEDILRQIPETRFPENWRNIPAFIEERVWALDATSYFSRPGPRIIDGAEILAKILHPGVFGEPNPSEAVRIQKSLFNFSK
ncbi:MAG: cobalamin-binding protein [Acidobacteriota bacterium]